MFMSGVVKLTSGDESWWDLTALNLPLLDAAAADGARLVGASGAQWLQKFSTAFTLVCRIVVPFLIWAPRRLRLLAAALLIGLQVMIALTGNYAFFNLLTIVLCLLLIDDRRSWRASGRRDSTPATSNRLDGVAPGRAHRSAAIAFLS